MTRLFYFPVAIHSHGTPTGGREWEREITAANVVEAINVALAVFCLRDGELLHTIHVGRPRPVTENRALGDLRDRAMSRLLDERETESLREIAAKLSPDVWLRIEDILNEPEAGQEGA